MSSRSTIRTDPEVVDAVLRLGGRRWTKNGKDRIYLNAGVLARIIRFDVARDRAGTVTGGVWRDRTLAVAEAARVWRDLQAMRVWFDLCTDRFESHSVPDARPLANLVVSRAQVAVLRELGTTTSRSMKVAA